MTETRNLKNKRKCSLSGMYYTVHNVEELNMQRKLRKECVFQLVHHIGEVDEVLSQTLSPQASILAEVKTH